MALRMQLNSLFSARNKFCRRRIIREIQAARRETSSSSVRFENIEHSHSSE
jgi:hypothetical protein